MTPRRAQLVRLLAVAAGVVLVPTLACAAGLSDVASASSGVWAFAGGFLGNVSSRWILLRRHEATCPVRVNGETP